MNNGILTILPHTPTCHKCALRLSKPQFSLEKSTVFKIYISLYIVQYLLHTPPHPQLFKDIWLYALFNICYCKMYIHPTHLYTLHFILLFPFSSLQRLSWWWNIRQEWQKKWKNTINYKRKKLREKRNVKITTKKNWPH